MLNIVRLALAVLFVFCLFSALERPAYAYVDPGSGLLAYQTLSAIAAGVLFHFRQKLRRIWRRSR